jgi:transposase-like protein
MAKKTKKKASTKKPAKLSKKKMQHFKCPHCKKTIAVVDLESIKDTRVFAVTAIRPKGELMSTPGTDINPV